MNILKNKKTWITISIVVLLAAVGIGFFNSREANAAPAAEAVVTSLDLAETIDVSGSLSAQPSASLYWKTTGTVFEVKVQAGEQVRAGDVLMTLEVTSAPSSVVSAQAELVTAQQNLDDLLNSDTQLAQAVIDLKEAQENFDKAENYLTYLQNDNKVPQSDTRTELVSTPNGYKYVYKTKNFKGPAPEEWITDAENDLALKKALLQDAQRNYDELSAGASRQEIRAAQAKVDAAQATVNTLSIIAPFDGEILYISSRPGDVVNTSTLAVNMADVEHLYVETQVDESDIANVRLGGAARVTLDALPGVELDGAVSAINPVGQAVSGLVKYTVRIDLVRPSDETFLPLGATANVSLLAGDAQSVLAVPIVAIQNDSSGEFLWVVRDDGSVERVTVNGGSIVGDLVVVSGEISTGDRVQLVRESSFSAPNPFGGN